MKRRGPTFSLYVFPNVCLVSLYSPHVQHIPSCCTRSFILFLRVHDGMLSAAAGISTCRWTVMAGPIGADAGYVCVLRLPGR